MPDVTLEYADLNTFADGFVRRFAERAIGLDEDSARIVFARPSDYVLTGFLTPVNNVGRTQENPEDQLASDLPRDRSYEQTSLGMHWLMPRKALRDGGQIHATVDCSVYVRRLPQRGDQLRAHWLVPRPRPGEARQSPQAEAVPVWTREDLGPIILASINLDELGTRRRIAVPLQAMITDKLSKRDGRDLYPGRHPLVLHQSDVETDASFETWRSQVSAGTWPLSWAPVLDLRISSVPTDSDVVRVAARIINRTTMVPRSSLDYVDPNLYAVRLHLSLPKEAHRPSTFRELPQSFRYDRHMDAVGINAHATLISSGERVELTTYAVPIHKSPRLEARTIPDAPPRFDILATDPLPTLDRILEAMKSYDTDVWDQAVRQQRDPLEQQEAKCARFRYQQEISRFKRGVDLLSNDQYPLVRQAFLLMNRTMLNANQGRFSEWRLFQLIFIVSQIPILAAREYSELRQSEDDDVDILWFAAGGGKTEAFLGVILWQAFFDRLRGKTVGVAAFVRFPLRLLTFQQLQRLSSTLAAAEMIRRGEEIGGAPFSIGYFVGSTTTPNAIDEDIHRRYRDRGLDPKLQRLYTCPFCGAPTSIAYDAANRLVQHYCTRHDTGCPNGQTALPVYVIDKDVYRYLPTIVISTVDKLAQFGQNQRFAQLMGRITMVCPEHGATFLGANDLCPAARELDRGHHPATCGGHVLDYGPFHDLGPSILIQDELHLLSEELGTFDAHYETAVAQLARSLGGQPWKVVAATATIENYKEHAGHLYLRHARQFPGPGPSAYESFYYTQNPDKLGRIYVGILGVGRKHTPAVTRALALIYLELQRARDLAADDLPSALARYGLQSMDHSSFTYLAFLYEIVLTYVLTRKGSDQVAEAIDSRVKKDVREYAPNHGDLLVDTFNGGASEAEMSEAVQKIREANPNGPAHERIRGIVATNVIGHGVDVDRFNVMLFAGFPRLVAEYIQASARVGRSFPGISFYVATPQSERDRSIFDRFVKFHEYVDRLVDPSAITRWPEPAMRRTVPGLLAGYLMGVASTRIGSRLATVERVLDEFEGGASALRQDEIVEWMEEAYCADLSPSGERYREQLRLATQNMYSSIINQPRIHGGRPTSLQSALGSMQSLRDTDDPGYIIVMRPDEAATLRRLIRG